MSPDEAIEPAAVAPRPGLTALGLVDFRSYSSLDLKLSTGHVVLVGDNGAGKTNVLEAVSLLAPGRGLRRATLDSVARAGGPGGWTVSARLAARDGAIRLGTAFEAGSGEGEARSRQIRIDGEPAKSAEDLLDYLTVLWLTPSMDGLFAGPAADRRRFLDRLVLALDPRHGTRVALFEKTMRGRNRLLEDDRPDAVWLDAIEAQLAELGVAIASARVETVACLARLIAAGRDDGSPFPHANLMLEGEIEAMAAAGGPAADTEDRYRRLLAEGRRRDAGAGRTLDGPHRADLVVEHGPKRVAAERSSTGEQKALLIGLVLAHARLVAETRGCAPILLLDEIAAHLDERRRSALFDRLDALGGQCWMTGTDAEAFRSLAGRAQLFEVAGGGITPT
ncbi:MAG: DNA replication/repair protein RecF [Ancalomicrobiaceae bacterium]|nr:DNA replication/repair protein RecF [Ancalomicrobiaceae bacterium]